MRLIDADKLVNRIVFHSDMPLSEKEAFEDAISEEPSVDAVPVVRCKECKHWEGEKRGQFWYFEQCALNQHIASCDDYCSCAERRTDG